MKLVVSGGGTGGHVYPALTVIETLLKPKSAGSGLPVLAVTDLLWIGSQGGMEEELVTRAGVEFIGLATGGLRGMGLVTQARHTARIVNSIGKARSILSRFKPDAVLVTGGYVCVAVTLAARIQRVPVLIYLPDIVPGQAIRFLIHLAKRVAVTSEESCHYLKREKAFVTGYPVRPEIFTLDRAESRRMLELDPNESTVLVFGGSRGARSINQALIAGLRELLPVCQVLHITGRLDVDWVAGAAKTLPEVLRQRFHYYPYLHHMPQALVAADLAVARAGAATMGEFPAAGLPAILVPYPYSGQHQEPNARYMARNGAALVLSDAEVGEKLVPTILRLLADKDALAGMQESTRAMARSDAAEAITEQLWLVAREREVRRTGVHP